MAKWMQNRKLTTLTRVVVLIALYFVGGLIGKGTAFLSGSLALVWPPAGIALAAILLFGYRFWPGIAVGAVLFSFIDGVPFGFFTFGTAVGNTIGAVTCGWAAIKSNHLVVPLRWAPTPTKSGGPVRQPAGQTGGGGGVTIPWKVSGIGFGLPNGSLIAVQS